MCKMHIGSSSLLQHCVCLMTSALNPPVKLSSQYGCRAALRAFRDVRLWTTSRESEESEESDGWRGPHWQRAGVVAGWNVSFLRRARWSDSQTACSNVPGKKQIHSQNALDTGMKHIDSESIVSSTLPFATGSSSFSHIEQQSARQHGFWTLCQR